MGPKGGIRVGISLAVAVLLLSCFFFTPAQAAPQTASGSCVQSGTHVFQNSSFSTENSQFYASFTAVPNQAEMNGVVGFSLNGANSDENLAAIVRFAQSGMIDVRNGSGFSANVAFPYRAGQQYTFQLVINPATKRYNVFVNAPGGSPVQLASNYAFRSSLSNVSSLNNWAVYTVSGTESVCNMFIVASTSTEALPPSITTQPLSQTIIAGQTATFSVTATGAAPVSYQWRKNGTAITGATASGYTTPAETTADNGAQFSVVVSNSAGTVTSSAAMLTVNAATIAPTITAQPLSQTIIAGQTATFSVTATGTAPLSYQWRKNGTAITGATASSYTTPAETTADNSAQFTVAVSNSTGSVISAAATLTVTAPGTLTPSSSTLTFGSVTVSTSSTLSATLTNTGSSSVTVSGTVISGPGFTATGISVGQIIPVGQTATLKVTFAPASTASVTGNVTITSNASNSPTMVSFSGTGAAAVSHSATLTWTASTSPAIGYNVYRSTVSGGPYTKVTASVTSGVTYSDTSVQSGQTYYYVVTAVNSSLVESVFSSQVSATIP